MKKILLISLLSFFVLFSHAQSVGFEWAIGQGGTGWEMHEAVDTDPAGNIVLVGSFDGTMDVDPGPGVLNFTTTTNASELFIQKLDPLGNLLWAKQIPTFGTGDSLTGKRMNIDPAGNVLLLGLFSGTVDFDPGPNTFNLTSSSSGARDIFILKLDAAGNFVWAKQMEGGNYKQVSAISTDGAGNVYYNGYFYGTVDFDPGAGTFPLTAHNQGDFYFSKLDPSGDLLWVRSLGNGSYNRVGSSQADQQGNFIMTGMFTGALDADPGQGVSTITASNNSYDIFSLKLDQNGDFLWVIQLEGTNSPWKEATTVDQSGNIFIMGSFWGTVDVDPGPGRTTANSGSPNNLAVFLLKLSPQGIFQWARQIYSGGASNGSLEGQSVFLDEVGNLYLTGNYFGEIDFDPGSGIQLQGTPGIAQNYFLKLNAAGDFVWVNSLERSNVWQALDMSIDVNQNVYLAGSFFDPMDCDPGSGSFVLTPTAQASDIFLVKWSQDSCSNFSVVIDSLLDVSCADPGFVSVLATGGKEPYSYSWNTTPVSTDSSVVISQGGLYEVTVTDSIGCTQTSTVLVGSPSTFTQIDLVANITSTPFRTGFPACIWLDAFNDGCVAVDGQVRLILDPFLTFDSASVVPDSIVGNVLIWEVSNMDFDSPHFMTKVDVTVSTQAMIGDRICLDANISTTGNDNNTKNNIRDLCRDVINAYDPNDKLVSPQGLCDEGYIENSDALTYTVRFQNTGNADAINIFILDTLDTNLNINSLKVVGKSHSPMITEVLEGRVLRFQFDNIHLPDSNTHEAASHGYVMFEISPNANLPVGTEIKNKAGIYFDFNEPIITNTVLNTITDVLPTLDSVHVQANACNSYTYNGRTYTTSGEFIQRTEGLGSCDSVIVLNLTLQPLDTSVTVIGQTLTANEGGAHGLNVSYQWVDCDNGNAPISGATSQSFTPANNGNYAVIISRDDCSEISACQSVMNVGIDPEFQAEITYYPNPTSGRLVIELGDYYAKGEVAVLNVMGQLVKSEILSSTDQLTLALPEQDGLYFIQIQADGKRALLKVLKQ